MNISAERVRQTQEALKEHSSLPLLKRLGRRALGKYPDSQARNELRRYAIGPWGRIREDACKTVTYTRKLNRIPLATLAGEWRTASLDTADKEASIPYEFDASNPNDAVVQAVNRLFKDPFGGDSVGVFVRGYRAGMSSEEVDKVGLLLMNDYNAVDAVVLTDELVRSFDPDTLQTLETAVSKIEANAFTEYLSNRPDRVG